MTTGSTEIGVSCPRCGVSASRGARFCAGCGERMAVDAIAVDSPPPSPIGGRTPAIPPPGLPAPLCQPPSPPAPGPAGHVGSSGAEALLVESSAIGRRASPLGWVMVVLVSCAFLAASIGVVVAASRQAGGAPGSGSGAPLARWDRVLYDGSSIANGTPFTIEVEAVNPAEAATDPLWLVIDWTPDGLDASPLAAGRVVSAEPEAAVREVTAAGRTVISWPGLEPGGRLILRVTVVATGLEPGGTFWYRVRTGSGPDEPSLRGGYTWDLDLEVE